VEGGGAVWGGGGSDCGRRVVGVEDVFARSCSSGRELRLVALSPDALVDILKGVRDMWEIHLTRSIHKVVEQWQWEARHNMRKRKDGVQAIGTG
jgi:hypothetical protein